MTAPIDSRQGPGTLTFEGTVEVGVQCTNIRLVPTVEEIDGTPTVGDPNPTPETQDPTWSLEGTAIQDWTDPAGFQEYCRDNSGVVKTFTWVPSTAAGVSFTGSCVIKAVEIGGDAKVQTTTDFAFRVVGQPSRVDA